MQLSHNELKTLYSWFPQNVRDGIDLFMSQDFDDPECHYDTEKLWDLDMEIGGIGGYCLPADPRINLWPAGEKRSLYRPLQYARSYIDICDVRMLTRSIVEMSGMHLEAACRKYLQETHTIGSLLFQNTTLGKAVNKISKTNRFDEDIIDKLYLFVSIYNLSKHEINQDETKERMFNAFDAIVSYFAVRLLGVTILKATDCEEVYERYEVVHNIKETSKNLPKALDDIHNDEEKDAQSISIDELKLIAKERSLL